MTQLILAISTCLLSIACFTKGPTLSNLNERENKNLDSTRIEQLQKAYDIKDYSVFFNQFPSSFNELIAFYGYSDSEGAKPLYLQYENHINYFFQYDNYITSEYFAEKAYLISINGYWEADAVSLFQSNLYKSIIYKPEVYIKLLNKKSDAESKNFWHFIFDGSTKNDLQIKEMYKTTYEIIQSIDERQSELLKSEFEIMYK